MIKKESASELEQAVKVLKAGGTILYPTDTIWGIGCDATNQEAIKKIYRIKQREESKSMLVLIDRDIQLNKYVRDVPAIAWDLIELTEEPLTIIYSHAQNLAPGIISPDGSIGIRIVKDDFCKELIRKLGKPIVSTSANVSNQPSPGNFSEISKDILSAVDYVINLRQNEMKAGKASAIIKLQPNGTIEIIRK